MPSRQKEAENQNDFGRGPVNNFKEGQKRDWWGKLTITQTKQDQIDPYLSCFYNTYSLASGFTNPYIDSETPPNATFFKVNTDFIAEGEEDHVKVNTAPTCVLVINIDN